MLGRGTGGEEGLEAEMLDAGQTSSKAGAEEELEEGLPLWKFTMKWGDCRWRLKSDQFPSCRARRWSGEGGVTVRLSALISLAKGCFSSASAQE